MWFELSVVETLVGAAPSWLIVALIVFSFLGSSFLLTPIAAVLMVVKPTERVLTWVAILFGAYVVRSLAKTTNNVSRPSVSAEVPMLPMPEFLIPYYLHPVTLESGSFPSGHMVAAVAFWGIVAIDVRAGSRQSKALASGAVVMIVGASRVLLGAHWIEDVIVGGVVGLVFLGVMYLIRERADRPLLAVFGAVVGLSGLSLAIEPSATVFIVFSVTVFLSLVVLKDGRHHSIWSVPSVRRNAMYEAGAVGVFLLAILIASGSTSMLLLAAMAGIAVVGWHDVGGPRYLGK